MRKSTVVNLGKIHGIDFFVKNRLSVLICLLFVAGVTSGVLVSARNNAFATLTQNIISRFVTARSNSSFFAVFVHSLMADFAAMLVLFLGGGSLMGFIAVPATVASLGFIYGSVVADVCAEFALKGVAFNAVVLMPPAVVFFVCFLSASRHAFTFSTQIARQTMPKASGAGLFLPFKEYCSKFCIALFFCVFSALADAVLSAALLKFFDFGY